LIFMLCKLATPQVYRSKQAQESPKRPRND
jgi:hypothetical protein